MAECVIKTEPKEEKPNNNTSSSSNVNNLPESIDLESNEVKNENDNEYDSSDSVEFKDPLSVVATLQQIVKEESGVQQVLPEQVKINGSTTNSLCITIYPAQLGNLSFKCGDCNKIFKQLPSLKKHAILHLTKLESVDSPTVPDGTTDKKDFDEGQSGRPPVGENVSAAEKTDLVKNEFNSDEDEEEEDEEPVKRRKPLKDGAAPIKLETAFKCDHCGMKFAHKKSIYRHVLRQHKEKLDSNCDLCNRVFANPISLRNHQRAAHKIAVGNDGKEHQCPYCTLKFELKTYLQKHLKMHDNVLYNCEECGKNFRSNKYLTAHRRLHSEEPKIQCSICNKVFMFQFNLREHMGIHSNAEKLFNCEQCNKSFRTQMLLKLHTLNHPTERQFQCNVCAKRFGYKHLLEVHMRLHTGERPFKCDKCGKGFRSTHSLTLHMDTHLDERKFTCEVCGTAFKAASYLRKHMVLHGEARHKCSYCNKCFKIKSSLLNHIRTHTGEKPFSCETCGMAFPKKSALNDHSWTHKSVKRYNCELCKRGFSRKEFLRNHSCQARQIPAANLLPQPVTVAPSFAIKYEPATLSLLNLNPQQPFIASP